MVEVELEVLLSRLPEEALDSGYILETNEKITELIVSRSESVVKTREITNAQKKTLSILFVSKSIRASTDHLNQWWAYS